MISVSQSLNKNNLLFKTKYFDNRDNLFYNFIIKYPPKERDPLEVKKTFLLHITVYRILYRVFLYDASSCRTYA